jgi:hypothetical protein
MLWKYIACKLIECIYLGIGQIEGLREHDKLMFSFCKDGENIYQVKNYCLQKKSFVVPPCLGMHGNKS